MNFSLPPWFGSALRTARAFWLWSAVAGALAAGPDKVDAFLQKHCVECHDAEMRKGGLDLTALKSSPSTPLDTARWVKVHDRVRDGEMPPAKKPRPATQAVTEFTRELATRLTAEDEKQMAREGRATLRRLNRLEYENTVRDLLHAPWLQLKDTLPEDGVAQHFNKSGDALDISYVQMARYLATADLALHQVLAPQVERPSGAKVRYYARDQRSYTGPMTFSVFNTAPERATFPVLGTQAQPDVRAGKAPLTIGTTNAAQRDLEGMGVVAGSYEPLEPKFNNFRAPTAGRYRLRFHAYSVWVGPGPTNKWFIPNLDDVGPGRRSEPITIYSEVPPNLLRWLGKFDVTPDPSVKELEVWLLAGETIRPDPARLFRSRPGPDRWQNPLAEKDGQPGVVFRWMEVEGPLHEVWPPAGHQVLFGNLPLTNRPPAAPAASATASTNRPGGRPRFQPAPGVQAISSKPLADAERLLRGFVAQAYRRPVGLDEHRRFLPVVEQALQTGSDFTEALITGYTAVLCSPEFLRLTEEPGVLDDYALASRLSYFLWNTAPDEELRTLARRGRLHRPDVLRAQTERLLNHPNSRQFVDAFLDYWLDLRKMLTTAPDATLYPDYYLDDLLTESAQEEPRSFFGELLRTDLPARNLVASDFVMVNEKLARHYQLTGVEGIAHRRVPVPPDSPRGGLMTQAAILKVTANGTTTSPVLRGAWIMDRLLGQPPPPPPPNVPAVEPDIRGAVTLRQQLEKHRTQESCNACHRNIDPPGFALESFDVMGGWRDTYRADGTNAPTTPGIGKGGQKFTFHAALPVDASGQLPDGRPFQDIREFKQRLLTDEAQIARNLARQLTVYATGAPIRFGDRARIEALLQRARARNYGVRTLVHEVVQSDLFRKK